MHNLFWALLILFAIAALLRLDWVYYLAYVVGGVWLVSHWWIRRSFRNLAIERRMLYSGFVGERINVTVRLTNRSWLPLPWLQIEDRVPLDLKDAQDYRWVVSVGSRAVVDHSYRLYCKRRGYYPVGPLSLNTGDLFGFAEAGWQEAVTTHVTVYPLVVSLDELGLPSRSPFGTISSRQRLFEDPNRMSGVREYMVGDSQRSIHWKASAHENDLLVKKFQPAIALNVAIILDLNRQAYPINSLIGSSEWAITVAASVASYVVGQRQPVGLITNGLDSVIEKTTAPIPTRQGQGQLTTILSALARVQINQVEQDLAQWLPRQIAGLEWGTTLVVVTPYLDDDGLWVLHEAYRRGSNVIVLHCATQPNYEQIRTRAARLNVRLHRTIWERDLHSLQKER